MINIQLFVSSCTLLFSTSHCLGDISMLIHTYQTCLFLPANVNTPFCEFTTIYLSICLWHLGCFPFFFFPSLLPFFLSFSFFAITNNVWISLEVCTCDVKILCFLGCAEFFIYQVCWLLFTSFLCDSISFEKMALKSPIKFVKFSLRLSSFLFMSFETIRLGFF